jgi:hypothetical protein
MVYQLRDLLENDSESGNRPSSSSKCTDESFCSSSCSRSIESDESPSPVNLLTSPTPTKSSLGRMRTIKESRIRKPLLSPVAMNHTDVFGESISSLNVWEEEDIFSSMVASPTKQQRSKRKSQSKSSRKQDPLKGLSESMWSLNLDA